MKVNVDNDVTSRELAEINTNKPPQSELFQDEMAKQVIILDDYKKDKQPFIDTAVDNVASEDKADKIKPIDVTDNYFDATQDGKDQREKSNVSLVVASNAEVVLCPVNCNVKNEQDENKNTYYGIDLPSQDVSDSSDEESTAKKSKRFTFTTSDFPDTDEIRDLLMLYPKPAVIDSFRESESEYSSEDESYKFLRRFRNKTKPVRKVDLTKMFEKLPERVITRQRKPTFKLLSGGRVSNNNSTFLKPIYLAEQEDQIDEDIILENIKRIKLFKKAKSNKDYKYNESIKTEQKKTTPPKKPDNKSNEHKGKVKVKIGKPETKGKHLKTKSFARNNPKEDSLELNSVSASKTITRRTRSMNKEKDGKDTQKKYSGNKNKKPDHKRKPHEGRRSKRQRKANEKNDDTMKAPTSIHKKNKLKQSNVYNVTSSSSESPKSLKRSLVDDSDVPSLKRTRSQNNNNNNSINNTNNVKTQHVHLSAFPGIAHKLDKQDPYVRLERYESAQKPIRTLNSNRNYLTRSQLALKRFHRSCKRTRESARTSTNRR